MMMDEPTPAPDEQVADDREALLAEPEVEQIALGTAADDQLISRPDVQAAETVVEPKVSAPRKVPVWEQMWRWFAPGRGEIMTRLNELTDAIAMSPEAPSNYVVRGELYMELREYELAEADFQRGFELAQTQFETADWGVMEQVMRDRALAGLEKVTKT